jgi:hypothetical protein
MKNKLQVTLYCWRVECAPLASIYLTHEWAHKTFMTSHERRKKDAFFSFFLFSRREKKVKLATAAKLPTTS